VRVTVTAGKSGVSSVRLTVRVTVTTGKSGVVVCRTDGVSDCDGR